MSTPYGGQGNSGPVGFSGYGDEEWTPDRVNRLHRYSDLDTNRDAQHHSLGRDPDQASPGNHNHDGQNSEPISGTTSGGGGGLPTGTIILIAAGALPAGYLACSGQAVARVTYPQLFQRINIFYGAGDGTNTFNLPNIAPLAAGGGNSVEYVIKT